MQKWEYLFISCDYENSVLYPKLVNGQELSNWKDITLYDYCNKLGDEGWEMVNIVTHGAGHMTYAFRVAFKRPKEFFPQKAG